MSSLSNSVSGTEDVVRLRISVSGAVQGVGFRPFVYRLAHDLSLSGWITNGPSGVTMEVQGSPASLNAFQCALESDGPSLSSIHSVFCVSVPVEDCAGFQIRPSEAYGIRNVVILPDIATCEDCLREMRDPQDRRYLYPFINCTNCGPRFTIIEAVPYDRPNTTMRGFPMCPECHSEYEDPSDRRFHAQPIACPTCGPHLELWDEQGRRISAPDVVFLAADALRCGMIVALKGIGGFQLLVDARRQNAVERLRHVKNRKAKPFALMVPDVRSAREFCRIDETERQLLISPEAPIVLLRRIAGGQIAEAVAPGNPWLGVMLPYSPVHHLLMDEIGFPIVATSGNLSDEPICTCEHDAVKRLSGMADLFLVHNRPIARHADDSVVRVMAGRSMVLRRARGYAPFPVRLSCSEEPDTIIATGAHLKNTVAVNSGKSVFISQHLGDLETPQALQAFDSATRDLPTLYELKPSYVACDLHPDYASTRAAQAMNLPLRGVQHHYAHVLSCLAENEIEAPALGVSWDGTGYGTNGTIWGGEFLLINDRGFCRTAHLRQFRLPGGDRAVKEPWRTAAGVLFEMLGPKLVDHALLKRLSEPDRQLFLNMLVRRVNCPITTSAGRLFDAAAALVGMRDVVEYEGQAAMELEFALPDNPGDEQYSINLLQGASKGDALVVGWQLLFRELMDDVRNGVEAAIISARFHNAMSKSILLVAERVQREYVALSGGCFQNRYLTERTIVLLNSAGFKTVWHRHVPPNDNGISLGQIVAVIRERRMVN